MARMSVDDRFLRDPRVVRMGIALGWNKWETRGRLLDVFAIVYDRVNADRDPLLSELDIDTAAEFPGLAAAMVVHDLAVKTARGLHVRGSKEHTNYLATRETAGRAGGVKSGETRRKKAAQKSKVTFDSTEVTFEKNEGRSNPLVLPSASSLPFDLSLPPALACDPDSGPSIPPNLSTPQRRGDLRRRTWGAVSEQRIAVALELGLLDVIGLPVITPAETRGYRDLGERIREEGDNAESICTRVVAHLVDQAREERSVEWLSEKAFTPGGWRTARDRVAGQPSLSSRKPARPSGRVEPSTPAAYGEGDQPL